MPMQYTDELILDSGKHWIGEKPDDETMRQYRERCAKHIEVEYRGYMEAWEIRTGREWTSMNMYEADVLLTKHPSLIRNPGFLSRLFPEEKK